MDISATDHLIAAAAAVLAGLVNAVAGGGTLISFPTLVALGLPAVSSNITNTVALCPGYVGGTFAQRRDLRSQRARLPLIVGTAAAGGLIGSTLLVVSSEELFRTIVPFLLLGACALLALGDRIKAALPNRTTVTATLPATAAVPVPVPAPAPSSQRTPPAMACAVFAIGIYAGYFGAGMGIVALAVLGIALDETMVRINALKQLIAVTANVVAACFFMFSGKVELSLVLVMAPASLVGGNIGGRVVQHLNPAVMRAIVIVIGIAVALNFWI